MPGVNNTSSASTSVAGVSGTFLFGASIGDSEINLSFNLLAASKTFEIRSASFIIAVIIIPASLSGRLPIFYGFR